MRWSILFLALCSCSKTEAPKPEAITTAAPTPSPAPREPTVLERLDAQTDLAGGLGVIGGRFKDSRDDMDPAAAVFAGWSTKHMTWLDLQKIPETKFALVLKDPEAVRGKRLCSSGSIVEIRVDRSSGKPVYIGGLMSPSGNVTRFLAVGSSGELVERSQARVCGVVTGTYSYGNSGGGTTHAVNVVGMFDLPDNK
jgi:hypothetical protein